MLSSVLTLATILCQELSELRFRCGRLSYYLSSSRSIKILTEIFVRVISTSPAEILLLFRSHTIEICIAGHPGEDDGEREQPCKAHRCYRSARLWKVDQRRLNIWVAVVETDVLYVWSYRHQIMEERRKITGIAMLGQGQKRQDIKLRAGRVAGLAQLQPRRFRR